MTRKLIILIVIFGILAVTACNPVSPQEKANDAAAQVCKDLVLYSTSVDKLLNQEYTDRNALEAQFSVVRTNFSNLVQSIANLKTVQTDNFQQAANDLISAYQNVPADASVTDTVAELKEPIAQVKLAADQLTKELKCQP
jgi:hypothetical protein